MSTSDLVNLIYSFCLTYSGIVLFEYQAQFAKRIIRSVIEGDGAELTALFARQSGKSEVITVICGGLTVILPLLANWPMFAEDKRLKKFKTGLLVGIFAPSLNQSQIIFGRMKKRLGSKTAMAVMADPEVLVTFDVSNGQNFLLSNGSLTRCQSASDGANIEGDSYMIIICDESQDIGNFKYLKSISPMGAFYNSTKVLIGTPSRRKGFFYNAIERNKAALEKKGARRDHFEYNFEVVEKYNPDYAKYIVGEKKRLGEMSDEFQMSYNLKWVLQRGMFLTSSGLEKILDEDRDFVEASARVTVAGIDLGKKHDPTTVAVGEVDFDNPIVVEKAEGSMEDDYIAYNVDLINLKEYIGDDWNTQYYSIVDHLSKFTNLRKVVIDATGVGSPIVDRLKANTDYEIEEAIFSRPMKSLMYKRLDTEIKAERFRIPSSPEARDTILYAKMEKQFLDLEKDYKGQFMVVQHPDEAGAHDDIPDACAMMCWATRKEPTGVAKTSNSTLFGGRRQRAGARLKSMSRAVVRAR